MNRPIPRFDSRSFGISLVKELQSRGLGAMAKRELDALLLYLLEQHSDLGSLGNHEAGLLLRAPASRIKTLRHEAMFRFVDDLTALASQLLVKALKTSRYNGQSDMLILVVEDAFGRDALLAEFKACQSFGTCRIGNSEVIEASSEVVIELLGRLLTEEQRDGLSNRLNESLGCKAKKNFQGIMRAVFEEAKKKSAGAVIDLAKDKILQHISSLGEAVEIFT